MARRKAATAPVRSPAVFSSRPRSYCASGSLGSAFDGLAKRGQRARAVVLPAQSDSQAVVCRGIARIQLDGAAKFHGGAGQIAELALRQSQLEMQLSRGLGCDRAPQFVRRGGRIVLLQKNAPQIAMRTRVGWIEGQRGLQFFERGRLVVQIVRRRPQPVMGLRPFRLQFYGGLELASSLSRIALIFQREGQVVVRLRIGGLQRERFPVVFEWPDPNSAGG